MNFLGVLLLSSAFGSNPPQKFMNFCGGLLPPSTPNGHVFRLRSLNFLGVLLISRASGSNTPKSSWTFGGSCWFRVPLGATPPRVPELLGGLSISSAFGSNPPPKKSSIVSRRKGITVLKVFGGSSKLTLDFGTLILASQDFSTKVLVWICFKTRGN